MQSYSLYYHLTKKYKIYSFKRHKRLTVPNFQHKQSVLDYVSLKVTHSNFAYGQKHTNYLKYQGAQHIYDMFENATM